MSTLPIMFTFYGSTLALVGELAKRIRAARAYAGFSQRKLGELLEVDEQTVKRTEAGKRTPKRPELLAIANECGVPDDFVFGGFDALGHPTRDELVIRIRALEEIVSQLAGDLGPPPGGLRQELLGESPTREAPGAQDNPGSGRARKPA